MDQFLLRNGLDSIEVLHNSCICAEGFRLCGTRGWLFENGQPHDEKVLAREAGRLRISLEAAKEKEGELLVFLQNLTIDTVYDGIHYLNPLNYRFANNDAEAKRRVLEDIDNVLRSRTDNELEMMVSRHLKQSL